MFNRHGQKWYEFRTKVQQPMLQPRTAKFYIGTIEDTAISFVNRLANYYYVFYRWTWVLKTQL